MGVVALDGFGWFRWRGAVWLGALTYPLYLVHEAIGVTALETLRDTISPWPLLIGVAASCLLLAWILHRLVERPFERPLKRLLRRAIAAAGTERPAEARA